MLNSTAVSFIVIYTLQAVFIVVGNTFAIFVFWTHKLHQKRTCFILINLAVADLLVGIAEPIVLTTEKIPRMRAFRGQKIPPNPSSALQLLGSITSVFFLALISLERVYAVLWPLRHRVTNTRVYICSIVIVWVVGLCAAGMSVLSMYYPKVNKRYVTVVVHTLLFISLLVITASYLKISRRLRYTPDGIAAHKIRSTETNLRVSRTIFMVIALSLVFWLPAFTVYTIGAFCRRCFTRTVVSSVNALHLANSMVNPLVYIFRMPIFRNAVRKKFCCRQRQNVKIKSVPVGRLGFTMRSESSFTLHLDPTVLASDLSSHRSTDSNVKIREDADDDFQLKVFSGDKDEHGKPVPCQLLSVRHNGCQ